MTTLLVGDVVLYIIKCMVKKYRKKHRRVQPEDEIKPIQNILQHITHLTTMALDDRKKKNYEESKLEITLEDIKRKGRTFKE